MCVYTFFFFLVILGHPSSLSCVFPSKKRRKKKKEHSLFEHSSYNYLTWEELAGCLLVETSLARETGETPAVWCGDRNVGLGEGTSAVSLHRLLQRQSPGTGVGGSGCD